jgi:thioesterase domain-containing protein
VRIEPIVQLREGSHGPPVFLEHGLGGSVAEFFEVLKHVKSNRPMFGLQMKGIDGIEKPLDRIEDIARFHLEVIHSVQSQGPYTFVGYSFGGLTAFEMSRILLGQTNEVALLVMVESFPHLRYLPFGQQTAVVKRRLRRYASTRLGANKSSSAYRAGGGAPERPQFGERFTMIMQTVSESANEALSRYRPRAYKDKVKFVKAAISTEFAEDAVAIWSKLTAGIDVETVPGDHFGILAGYASNLANVLSRYLEGTA